MHWLQTLDTELFRFINLTLINPVFDVVMPFVSGNRLFYPALVVLGTSLLWKGRARGVLCVLMLGMVIGIEDGVVVRNLKHAIGRPRPFVTMADTHTPAWKQPDMASTPGAETAAPVTGPEPSYTSMPSGHAANWFAATFVALVFYRRSIYFMLPLALLVSFSRMYNGVHYPSDILAGALVGSGCAAAILWSLNALWLSGGRKWFPLWWRRMPSLFNPVVQSAPEEEEENIPPPRSARGTNAVAPALTAPHVTLDQHWLRLGYIFIGVLLLGRLLYLASGTIQLSEDEAYQWVWSKHLALSYFSKPPLIAYTQFLGTTLWGDNAFGVRFFSPIIAAVLSFVVLRFFAREINARAGFFLLLIITATPLMSVGAILMTIDPLSVLFWTAAMLAGWRAVQANGTTRDWFWVGLWMGLGFLSKYTELFQLLCWTVFFALWAPARKHLRRPGPYLALSVNALCTLPVLIWNAQHQWITVSHVAADGKIGAPWHPTLRYLGEFLGSELVLLNPIFLAGAIWASIAFWRRSRHNPRLIYFFSMGAPLFLAYLLYTLHSRVLPNWIAPSALPLFCLMVAYWDTRWRLKPAGIKPWLVAGLALGLVVVGVGHNTNVVQKVTGRYLPVNWDPLHRVREWDTTARVVGDARQELLAEGKPVFIVGNHYGMVGQISFYLPEARTNVCTSPFVYFRSSPRPRNQFYFWPGYTSRKGENAIFVLELDRDDPRPQPIPAELQAEFESVTDLGVRNVMYHRTLLLRPLQIFACRGLR